MILKQVVLIDEPEISLHIDWQSLLIPEMAAQLQERQVMTLHSLPNDWVDDQDTNGRTGYYN